MDWFPDMFWLWIEWLLAALLFLALGLLIGWLLWRRSGRRGRTELEAELAQLRAEDPWAREAAEQDASELRARIGELETGLAERGSRLDLLRADLDTRTGRVEELEALVAARGPSWRG